MKVFICGGGTGGHFFSGMAVAEEILDDHPDSQIHFIGTRWGIEARVSLPDSRMQLHYISAKGLLGKGMISKGLGVMAFVRGFVESFFLLHRLQPDLVLGVGGYASAPTVAAALVRRGVWSFFIKPVKLLCKPVDKMVSKNNPRIGVLEQNSYAGLSNRFLRRLGAVALSAFPQAGFQTVNLPIRKTLRVAASKARAHSWPPKVIGVVGGSQGARGLNQAVMNLILARRLDFSEIAFVHQTGKRDEEELRQFYRQQGLEAEVFAFSDQMALFYERADLLICRAGAMTVFEVMAFRRPAIFIPFPAATHDHQTKNALSVQNSNWVVAEPEATPERLCALIRATEGSLPQSSHSTPWQSLVFK